MQHLPFNKIHDISIKLGEETVDYPGMTFFSRDEEEREIEGAMYRGSFLHLFAHCGTHMDAPSHLLDYQKTIDRFPLDRFIRRAVVLDIEGDSISRDAIAHTDLEVGDALLLRTQNSVLGRSVSKTISPEYTWLETAAAEFCVERSVSLVGFDYFVAEQPGSQGAVMHRTLLGNDIIILEGLNLKEVQQGIYTLICLPLKIPGCEGSPTRAVLLQ